MRCGAVMLRELTPWSARRHALFEYIRVVYRLRETSLSGCQFPRERGYAHQVRQPEPTLLGARLTIPPWRAFLSYSSMQSWWIEMRMNLSVYEEAAVIDREQDRCVRSRDALKPP